MRFRLVIPFLLGIFASGCASENVIESGDLPVYGTDPLMHTTYLGSDDRFHYFHVQHGKSGREVVVARDNVVIKPESFARSSGRSAFVNDARPGEIELIVLGQ